MLLCFCNPSCHGYVCAFPSHLVKQMWMLIRWLYSLCWNFPSPRLLISPLFFTYQKKKKKNLFSVFQIYRLLDFLACLLEHPRAKVFHPLKAISVKTFLQMNDQIYNHFSPYQPLLLKEGAIQMLIKALERCVDATESDGKQLSDGRNSAKCSLTAFSWCLPLCKSLSLICDSHMSRHYIGNYAKWVDDAFVFTFLFNFFFFCGKYFNDGLWKFLLWFS